MIFLIIIHTLKTLGNYLEKRLPINCGTKYLRKNSGGFLITKMPWNLMSMIIIVSW